MARFNWFAFRQDLALLANRDFSEVTDDCARIVRRRIARHHSIQENRCNRELSEREQNEELGLERRLTDFFGPAREVEFSGDPRGATVKLKPLSDAEVDAYRAAWGETPRLTYFERGWDGLLLFTGGR